MFKKVVVKALARQMAESACPYKPQGRYILFEFKIASCLTNSFAEGNPNVKRWKY